MNTKQDQHDHPSRATREEASTPTKRQERAIEDGHAMDHDNPAAAAAKHESPQQNSPVGDYTRAVGATGGQEGGQRGAPSGHRDAARERQSAHAQHGATGGHHSDKDRPPTKFRPEPRKLTQGEIKLRDEITAAYEDLDSLLQKLPGHMGTSGRAAVALEESHMWAMKDLVSS